MYIVYLCFLCLLPFLVDSSCLRGGKFPDGFKFGVATASYQIEGAWNEDGKGQNIWDYALHVTDPGYVHDGSNGDIACDSYHKYMEDINMLKFLEVDYYRLSLSWSRILPNGFVNEVNQKGVDYYNKLFAELEKAGIEPMVTLYHWDLPLNLKFIGGFTNEKLVDYFGDYAKLAFELFGDKVKIWSTFNEPIMTCNNHFSLMVNDSNVNGLAQYLCTHNLLKAHARAYHIYDEQFRPKQKGKISIVINSEWLVPATDSPKDIEAALRALDFSIGWYANPIYVGDYPIRMRNSVDEKSAQAGYANSRLPKFTSEEIEYIKGTYDYFGLNTYTTSLVTDYVFPSDMVSVISDAGVITSKNDSWGRSASDWLRVVPWGMRELLKYVKNTYNNPEIIITENGFSDNGEIFDFGRINYHQEYLINILDAMEEDDVNVVGYMAWSLLDNFEWQDGYTKKFGLIHVDFNDPERTRVPKASSLFYKTLCSTKRLSPICPNK